MKTFATYAGGDRMAYLKSELSPKNEFWLPKHRYYELKHYCLQYPEWKRAYTLLRYKDILPAGIHDSRYQKFPEDKIGKTAAVLADLEKNIQTVERACRAAGKELYPWLLRAVTQGDTYVQLQTMHGIPCGRDMFYSRYRKFFWLLSQER